MTSPPAQAQEIYWLSIAGVYETKDRVCVVLRVSGDRAQVIYGQSKRDPKIADEEVLHTSTAGRRMGLRNATYFRVTNVVLVQRDAFQGRQRTGICPSSVFAKLAALAQQNALQRAQAVAAATKATPATPPSAPTGSTPPPPASPVSGKATN